MDECAEKEKFNTLLEVRLYEPLTKNATTTTETQMQKPLLKIGPFSQVNLKQMETPHHSKLKHLYRLPKIHKPEVPL